MITDELRKYTDEQIKWLDMTKVHYRNLLAIADRIDEKHKRAIGYVDDRDPETMAENGWIRLPKDIDDEYIHIGDVVDCGESTFKVNELRLTKAGWNVGDCRHHKPTVEDLLREFAMEVMVAGRADDHEVSDAIDFYAPKLQLREVDE